MSRRTLDVIPKHRMLRRTLYSLLLAAPLMPLGLGCGNGEDCGYGPTSLSGGLVALNADGSLPSRPSCDSCPDQGDDGARSTGCYATASTVAGKAEVMCNYVTCSNDGRRPEGLREALVPESGGAMGALFAHAAWLEAASVPAFLRLADELKAHGAPDALVKAARRSAGDEVRHTRAMQALAERHGATLPDVDLPPFQARSLEEMLLENAVEGCVRETFGAFVAGWQSRTARDPEVRDTLRAIARDEVRHAELAWAVDAWAQERLTSTQRERLLQARRDALRVLGEEVEGHRPPEQLIRDAGMPSREQALTLFQGLAGLVA
ncbi:ferritin-like domain-containing protein [Corallococcus terminator]|uniref:Ferritin-like domain-containing protein n=1 Tax=Corallococcus terminator TaxID=2316733 RepID=A0A3A8HYZ9_9BACT|nr:ferritin-like domain-containing protein [Corallococcus terminator]RKG72700.1 ferritin-like domain-containing protein [Corallococcus terminator]